MLAIVGLLLGILAWPALAPAHEDRAGPRVPTLGVAPSFSECAPTSVASRSITTRPAAGTGDR